MEYKVTLTDHNYFIAPQHCLLLVICANEKRIALEIKCIPSLDIFNDSFNNNTSESKPIMIVTANGGSGENPRYTKTILFHHPGLGCTL